MGDAFERATRSLHDTGQPDLIKEVMAKRIMDAVRRGNRDPRELCITAGRFIQLRRNPHRNDLGTFLLLIQRAGSSAVAGSRRRFVVVVRLLEHP
jgi:hypothetical protein